MSKIIEAKVGDVSYKLILEGGVVHDYHKLGRWVEEYNIKFLMELLYDGVVVFDLGANSGIFSIPLAIKEKGAKIYAFEPSSQVFKLLQKNIQLNHLDNIFPYQVAVSNYVGKGTLKINDSLNNALDTLGEPTHSGCKIIREEEVLVTTLDEFVNEKNLPKVDVMKVDVEGSELAVFQGGENLLQSPEAPLLLFESQENTTKGFNYLPSQVIELLLTYGYSISAPKVRVYNTYIASKQGVG